MEEHLAAVFQISYIIGVPANITPGYTPDRESGWRTMYNAAMPFRNGGVIKIGIY